VQRTPAAPAKVIIELNGHTNLLQRLSHDVEDLGARLDFLEGSITSIDTTLRRIADRFDDAELICSTPTPIAPPAP